MWINPEFKEQLDRLPPPAERRRLRADAETLGASFSGWRLVRKGDGRTRSRMERLFARLFVPFDIDVHVLLDASLSMTFTGHAPPLPSRKFDYGKRLAAALTCAALVRYGGARLSGFATARGRRAPRLRAGECDQLESYLDSLIAGGATNVAAALRNALARGDDRTVFVLLSDFADPHWERGIPALMHGTSRVVLLQLYDPIPAAPADAFELVDPVSGLVRGLETGEERRAYGPSAAEDLRRRLAEVARQNDLEHFPLAVGTEFEAPLLRALGG